jgi:hypothetical protein
MKESGTTTRVVVLRIDDMSQKICLITRKDQGDVYSHASYRGLDQIATGAQIAEHRASSAITLGMAIIEGTGMQELG